MKFVLAQHLEGAKMVRGLVAQHVTEHPQRRCVCFRSVPEVFVERGGSSLKVVGGSKGLNSSENDLFGRVLNKKHGQSLGKRNACAGEGGREQKQRRIEDVQAVNDEAQHAVVLHRSKEFSRTIADQHFGEFHPPSFNGDHVQSTSMLRDGADQARLHLPQGAIVSPSETDTLGGCEGIFFAT